MGCEEYWFRGRFGTGLGIGFKFLQAAATKTLSVIVKGVAKLAGAIDSVVTTFGGSETGVTQYLQDIAAGIDDAANNQMGEAWQKIAQPPPSEGITSFFQGIKDSANDAAKSIEASSVKTKGASKTFVDAIKDEEDHMKDLKSKAKSLLEATATPLEKANMELATLQEALDKKILSQEEFDRLVGTQHKSVFGEGNKHAGALEFGSKEARSLLLEYEGKNMDPQKDIAKTAKEQLAQLRIQSGFVEKLVKLQEKEKKVEVADI